MTRKYPTGTPRRFPGTRSVRRTGGFVQIAMQFVNVRAVTASYAFRHFIRSAKGLSWRKPFPTVSRRE
jgi:hypothetical protein